MIARLSRVIFSHRLVSNFSPVIHKHPIVTKTSATSARFYLFPSVYRSYFSFYGSSINHNHSNLMPFRMALDGIKRRLFSAAPIALSLVGYSLCPQTSFESVNQISNLLSKTLAVDQLNDEHEKYNRATLENFELGRLLGYGCNAAVYEARLRSTTDQLIFSSDKIHPDENSSESDFELLSRQSSNSSTFDENDFEILNHEQHSNELAFEQVRYQASIKSSTIESDVLPAGKFNLAIKMLFNYGIQSNAEMIEKSMEKELLPLRKCSLHPNIVHMHSYFVDKFPLLEEAYDYFPMALPSSLSPDGYGRNKSLFIVMHRYDSTLGEYIRLNQPTAHQRLLLFAQLLEALLYLRKQSIVHRDLKSDNLLICNSTGQLVLADFGCALHQPPNLKLSYSTEEIDKGGNLALMAPEIVLCQAGPKSVLDYNKADLWSSGTLCYEFYSEPNPFFHGPYRQETYDDEQLPSLGPLAPPIIEKLAHAMLRKNPQERPSLSLITNCIHLCLWFPLTSLQMNKPDFYQTYMWTALETLFSERKFSSVELTLRKFFFQRQSSQTLYHAQAYINQFLI